jgi:acyl-CoA synthetase (AMP-forming)/AMP-acid ligase II
MMATNASPSMSVVHGSPLADEPGMGPLTIPAYLREVTQRYREREALVMQADTGVERWTYQDLWDRSVEFAKALIACGVGKNGRVGVLMTNRPEYLAAVFGCGLAGAVSVGLSTFSTPAELEQLLALSGVSVLLFDGRVLKKDFGAMLAELEPAITDTAPGALQSAKFPFLQHLVRLPSVTGDDSDDLQAPFERYADFLARGRGIDDAIVDARAATVAPTDAGGLFFSSGTTSLPKGILHAQRAFAIQWWRWPRVMSVEGAVRSWTGNGLFWSANITMVVGIALSTGGAVILQPYFEPETALKLMQDERITFLSGRPHQWARLQEMPNWASTDLSSLRYVTNADLLKTHPTVHIGWRLPMTFGTTETMTAATTYTANTSVEQYAGSAGEPLPGNTLKIVDPQTGAVVPRGQRGEICLKGPTLMLGYIGKGADETFDAEGYYCTGDGGYVDEVGRLYWEGRLTEIIKTGGANVSPLEIDAVLSTYPGVRRAQTVGVPHPTLSEMVVSCVVAQDGATLDAGAITAFLKTRLASFKVPKEILFFADDEVEVTGNGKVKSELLRQKVGERLGASRAAD